MSEKRVQSRSSSTNNGPPVETSLGPLKIDASEVHLAGTPCMNAPDIETGCGTCTRCELAVAEYANKPETRERKRKTLAVSEFNTRRGAESRAKTGIEIENETGIKIEHCIGIEMEPYRDRNTKDKATICPQLRANWPPVKRKKLDDLQWSRFLSYLVTIQFGGRRVVAPSRLTGSVRIYVVSLSVLSNTRVHIRYDRLSPPTPPAWKQNEFVLLHLYRTVTLAIIFLVSVRSIQSKPGTMLTNRSSGFDFKSARLARCGPEDAENNQKIFA
ncbi:hypothetical protein EVAR_28943_1 [Eumeta japonica]|uniref:Uncharacterized protein n=1 Tax=Eumeta variegata TaxID=151549 RepID=A0A4C1VXM0_EUMVA|nr:hypothetical protein EVAR_28943_1 [Eumeta japonica]